MPCRTSQGLEDKLWAEHNPGEVVKGQMSYLSVTAAAEGPPDGESLEIVYVWQNAWNRARDEVE